MKPVRGVEEEYSVVRANCMYESETESRLRWGRKMLPIQRITLITAVSSWFGFRWSRASRKRRGRAMGWPWWKFS